jgi:transcriptional regulator with XRE-family HTH domain
MAKSDTGARRLTAAGELLYGDRWQRRLAQQMGISVALLSMIVSGDRPTTDDVQRKLAAALKREAGRLRSSADKLDRLRAEIDAELG